MSKLKMTPKVFAAGLMLCGLALNSGKARAADCCNDFWSCAAAVATAGLSCGVQMAVDEIRAFVARAQALEQEGQRQHQAVEADYNSQLNTAKISLNQRFATSQENTARQRQLALDLTTRYQRESDPLRRAGQQIQAHSQVQGAAQINSQVAPINARGLSGGNNNASGGTNTGGKATVVAPQAQVRAQVPAASATVAQVAPAAQPQADRAQVLDAMNRGKQKVDELARKMESEKKREFDRAMSVLDQVQQQSVRHLNQVFVASFAAPLSGLIAPLLGTIPDPVTTAATIAAMVLTIDTIKRDFERRYPEAMNKAGEDAGNALGSCNGVAHAALTAEQEATEVTDAMQRLADNPTQNNLAALNRVLGGSGAGGTGGGVNSAALARNLNLVGMVRLTPAPQQNVAKSLGDFSVAAASFKNLKPANVNLNQFQSQRDNHLAQLFRNKRGNEAEQLRQRLLREAEQKFAGDIQKKNTVTKLINDEANKHKTQAPVQLQQNAQPAIRPLTPVKPIKQ